MFGAANGMLKEGARHYSGLEEAMMRNIDACQQLAQMTRTAYGPHGKFFILIICFWSLISIHGCEDFPTQNKLDPNIPYLLYRHEQDGY